MTKPTRRSRLHLHVLLLAALAGCATAAGSPSGDALFAATEDVATLRTEGPPALARLLARWDAMQSGAARDALGKKIDAVAAQRYATASRLFWYTDLAAAKAAAKAEAKPILSLRMLGRLDEDLSCANSRFFRVALYANADLSAFLRDRFILHWSSERAVPRITIDYGDGRTVVRTLTGNSAHYVLDADGRPLDVLPGLYAPAVFRAELDQSLALADRVRDTTGEKRAELIADHHRTRQDARATIWQTLQQQQQVALGDGQTVFITAQMPTVSKSRIEMPVYRQIEVQQVNVVPDDADGWARVALQMLPVASWRGTPSARVAQLREQVQRVATDAVVNPPVVLDDASRALLARLAPSNWAAKPAPAGGDALAALIGEFERDILADTAKNELELRQRIRRRFIERAGGESFDSLNAWLYADVFGTPASDPWLGMRPEGFIALPGDGLVSRESAQRD